MAATANSAVAKVAMFSSAKVWFGPCSRSNKSSQWAISSNASLPFVIIPWVEPDCFAEQIVDGV